MRVQLYENKGSKENPKMSDYPTILEVCCVSLTELGEIKERDRLLLRCMDKDEDWYLSERKISKTEYQEIMEKLALTGYADLTGFGTFTDDECPETDEDFAEEDECPETDEELAEEDEMLETEESRVESSVIRSDDDAADRRTKAWIIGVILVICLALGAGIAEFAWLKHEQSKPASVMTNGYVIHAGQDEEKPMKDTLYIISDSPEIAKGRTFTDTVYLGTDFEEGKEYTLKTELKHLTEEEYKTILRTYGFEYLKSGMCGELIVSKETKFTYDPNNRSFEVSITVPES